MELSVRRKRLSLQPLIRILMFYILMTMFVGIGSGFLLRNIKATRHAGKAVQGDGGDPAVIDLSHDQVRTLVFGYRGGAFDAKLRAMGLEPAVAG